MTVKWLIDSYLWAGFNPLEEGVQKKKEKKEQKKKKNHVSIKWRMNNGG